MDWKASKESVEKEALGQNSHFSRGLPSIGDGQMLFLCHLAAKMRPDHDGGGRAGIVLNGSPLFTGAAESGPSQIRQWLLESDLVEAIVALPTNMFFNTGIATYIWILGNTKRPAGSPARNRWRTSPLSPTPPSTPRSSVNSPAATGSRPAPRYA